MVDSYLSSAVAQHVRGDRPLWMTLCTFPGALLIAVLGALCLSSCSARNSAFSSLANQGLIPVSADSPYVGANVFLAKEMEDSLYLYNFMKTRGAPRAIELTGNSERSAELSLYYSAKSEVYRASPHLDPMTKAKEWIIKGPYAIERGQHREIAQLGPETVGAFEIFGRRELLGRQPTLADTRVIEPAYVPTPAPTPTPRKLIRKKTRPSSPVPQAQSTGQGPAIAIQGTPMNLDQQALIEAKSGPVKDAATPASPSSLTSKEAGSTQASPASKRAGALDEALGSTVLRAGTPSATSPAKK